MGLFRIPFKGGTTMEFLRVPFFKVQANLRSDSLKSSDRSPRSVSQSSPSESSPTIARCSSFAHDAPSAAELPLRIIIAINF